MKRTSDYFLQIKHIVFVEHDSKTYNREENIINGKISLKWILKKLNKHGTWDDVDYISDKKTIDVLK